MRSTHGCGLLLTLGRSTSHQSTRQLSSVLSSKLWLIIASVINVVTLSPNTSLSIRLSTPPPHQRFSNRHAKVLKSGCAYRPAPSVTPRRPSTATHRAPHPASLLPPSRGLPSGLRQPPVWPGFPPGPFPAMPPVPVFNILVVATTVRGLPTCKGAGYTSPKGCG